jgi:hypothetical protein
MVSGAALSRIAVGTVAEYQEPDWPVVDDEPDCMDERPIDPSRERPLLIRGPRPERIELRRYAVFLGSAEKQCAQNFSSISSTSMTQGAASDADVSLKGAERVGRTDKSTGREGE